MELYTNAFIESIRCETLERVSSGAAATQLSPVSSSDAYAVAINDQTGKTGTEHGGGSLDKGASHDLGGKGGGSGGNSGDHHGPGPGAR